jgi:hypothetical protein
MGGLSRSTPNRRTIRPPESLHAILGILVEARCRSAALARARARFGLARAAASLLATYRTLCAPVFFAVAIGCCAATRLHPS